MRKIVLGSVLLVFLVSSAYAKKVEQTICFSQHDTGRKVMGKQFFMASLGDNVTLNGGKCNGKTLPEMNKAGWKLIQVVTGLESSFGMVLEK